MMALLRKIKLRIAGAIIVMTGPMCDRVAEDASEQMDGARLPVFRRLGHRLHLAACDWCADYVENLHAVRRGMQGFDKPPGEQAARDLLGGLSESSKQRIIARLHEEDR